MNLIATPRGNVFFEATSTDPGRPTVVYVHGYYVNAAEAVTKYKLFDQFRASGVQATFIVPEAPKSNDQPVYFTDLGELLAYVTVGNGPVVAVAHSGGFRTILKWLSNPKLKSIALLDALYPTAVAPLTAWVKSGGKLVLFTAPSTQQAMVDLAKKVPVTLIKTGDQHMALVTAGKWIPEAITKLIASPIPWIVFGIGLFLLWRLR
jgi:predicted alpha/beta hydrolase family esterase